MILNVIPYGGKGRVFIHVTKVIVGVTIVVLETIKITIPSMCMCNIPIGCFTEVPPVLELYFSVEDSSEKRTVDEFLQGKGYIKMELLPRAERERQGIDGRREPRET